MSGYDKTYIWKIIPKELKEKNIIKPVCIFILAVFILITIVRNV